MKHLVIAVCCLGLLAGCAAPGQRIGGQSPVEERSTAPVGSKSSSGDVEQPGSAVVALLDQADRETRGGNLMTSAALLERAVRIEPRNGALWHRLAEIRLQQEQYALAESLALKSNALAGKDRALQALNWRLIARARGGAGNVQGAETAMEKAERLSNQ